MSFLSNMNIREKTLQKISERFQGVWAFTKLAMVDTKSRLSVTRLLLFIVQQSTTGSFLSFIVHFLVYLSFHLSVFTSFRLFVSLSFCALSCLLFTSHKTGCFSNRFKWTLKMSLVRVWKMVFSEFRIKYSQILLKACALINWCPVYSSIEEEMALLLHFITIWETTDCMFLRTSAAVLIFFAPH